MNNNVSLVVHERELTQMGLSEGRKEVLFGDLGNHQLGLRSMPLDSVRVLISLDMLKLATVRNPSATSSIVFGALSFSELIKSVISWNFFLEISTSRDSLALGPKILGNCSGTILPVTRFASVTVNGPPLR
ncbi:hypothetical protein OGAPHI_000903 [Ogataea philodendri]|uniref:Uncharacterized protein n=1 Tax=Ogataea philodendri TaxID=1378263 RepID=A0A9P8PDR8_9ASCO|nr:uncharacterized protein OGAPHI_000903 [Ogataea philodendri]KAH3670388.1 hypothetical protein OGAPHI_000903 [Ogataea philodendri]